MREILSVYDVKTESFGPLFLAHNVNAGMRLFSDAVNRGELEMVSSHPEDFRLMHLGSFDELASGRITPLEKPVVVIEAVNVIRVEASNGVQK